MVRRNMASFETITAVQPLTAVKGLRGSSLSRSKLFIKPSRKSFKSKSTRAGALVAKYGDISVIFAASQEHCIEFLKCRNVAE
ncbi:hypothetical protein HID58_070517 [Brassica napus]|uniref:Photosystem I reaction center subunit VI n=1 Tax=Brassica napus TaxID=3708 RepID=A0ABQ7YYY8_BRANA|nr:hypothetical protein HID58_070517 [Brassica napus]